MEYGICWREKTKRNERHFFLGLFKKKKHSFLSLSFSPPPPTATSKTKHQTSVLETVTANVQAADTFAQLSKAHTFVVYTRNLQRQVIVRECFFFPSRLLPFRLNLTSLSHPPSHRSFFLSLSQKQHSQDVGPSGSSLGDQVYVNGNVFEPAPGGGVPAADAPIVGRFDLSSFVTANLNATAERRQVRKKHPRFFPSSLLRPLVLSRSLIFRTFQT